MFVNHKSDKRFVSGFYEELLQFNNKMNNLIITRQKHRHFSKIRYKNNQ